MRSLVSAFLLVSFSFSSFALQQNNTTDGISDTRSSHYISDDLFVFLHAGPGRDYRILGSVSAGAPVTKTDKAIDNRFVEIIDDDGRTGWIEARHLSSEISRRLLIEQLKEKVLDTDVIIQSLHQEIDNEKSTIHSLTSKNEELKDKLSNSEQQLNEFLTQIEGRETDKKNRELMVGGGLVAGGLLLGVIIAYLPKKRKNSDSWMN